MNRMFLLISLMCIGCNAVFSQTDDYFYVFDKSWKPAKASKAAYFARQKKLTDSTWQFDTYYYKGPRIRSVVYKDEKCTIGHGQCLVYDNSGNIDSICNYSNGLAHGTWYIVNDAGKIVMKQEYDQGRLMSTTDISKPDSLKQQQKDTTNEKESEFPGSLRGWVNYLNKNLRYPQRAMDMNKQGEVRIAFVVDKDGKIEGPFIYKSVEFSLDEEALRIINASPDWVPAVKNGEKVKSYKIQPVVYRLTR